MKCLIIFAVLLAVAYAKPLENTDEIMMETAPCAYVKEAPEGLNKVEPEVTTLFTVGERAGESQEFFATPETIVPTEIAEIKESATNIPLENEGSGFSEESVVPETPAPTAAEEFLAATDAPVVFERFGDKLSVETPAPTEASEEIILTTSSPIVEEAPAAPETPAPTAAAEELLVVPETAAHEVVFSALRTPEVSEKPIVAPEDIVQIVVVPVDSASAEPSSDLPKTEEAKFEEPQPEKPQPEEPKPEEPKPEQPKPEEPLPEEPKPEEPKKLSRLITFTFYDRSSKATSLRHFLEYLRSLKK